MTMKKQDSQQPVGDPDQLVIAPVSDEKYYLGNANVVHAFVGRFADEVMRAYGGFLAGNTPPADAQRQISHLVKEYGDVFMGRDPRYEIAPWQGVRMRGKLLAAIDEMKGGDDPGHALFNSLALSCVKASMALADGRGDKEVGEKLKEILDDVRARILGVI